MQIDEIKNKIASFEKLFYPSMEDCQRFCFITRAEELQIEAREIAKTLMENASALKTEAISHEWEDGANKLLSYEMMARAIINELSMWVSLKDDNPHAAWDYLIEAESATIDAMHAHEVASALDGYADHLYSLEKHMFPNHGFFSIGAIIQVSICNICNQDFGSCDHLVGKPYMGRICYQIIKKAEVEEVSIVWNPANKHCRIQAFSANGGKRDAFTFRIMEDSKDSQDSPE